jgi:hypothetical protein
MGMMVSGNLLPLWASSRPSAGRSEPTRSGSRRDAVVVLGRTMWEQEFGRTRAFSAAACGSTVCRSPDWCRAESFTE